jgi:hypothetical protein
VVLVSVVVGCTAAVRIVQLEEEGVAAVVGVVQEGQTFYSTSKEDIQNEFVRLRALLLGILNATEPSSNYVGYLSVLDDL